MTDTAVETINDTRLNQWKGSSTPSIRPLF